MKSKTGRPAGIDWASKTHAVCVLETDGRIRARFDVPNTGKSFAGLIRRLAKLGVEDVAIERPDGPLVEAMVDAGLRVFVIAPRMVKALRQRYSASGAKSDPGDAYVAPVTKASGKARSVGFRWACDKKLRNALVDFADDSRHASPWAARIYADAITRGKRHPHAVRILARAWVRVIWRLWRDGEAYDVTKHGGAAMLQAA